MGSTINLGRVAGISIGVHWTLIAIFALITWSLWQQVLPSYEAGLSSAAYFVMPYIVSGTGRWRSSSSGSGIPTPAAP